MLWEMSDKDFLISFAFICCFSYIVGWLVDRILEGSGYGHIGNWLLILTGAYTGLYSLNKYGYEFHWVPLYTLGAALGGAFVILFSMCFIKRFAKN
ncbi:MAG: hypothetical protein QNJ29_13425 [Rhizobiaceae bacterium]|nr:hypothetical protein [Rhizobiaceae bacterium]